jgi:periplasmic protein TonB
VPEDLRVTRRLGLGLDEKAIDAVRQWRFRPALRNGLPFRVSATIEVNFRLPR